MIANDPQLKLLRDTPSPLSLPAVAAATLKQTRAPATAASIKLLLLLLLPPYLARNPILRAPHMAHPRF